MNGLRWHVADQLTLDNILGHLLGAGFQLGFERPAQCRRGAMKFPDSDSGGRRIGQEIVVNEATVSRDACSDESAIWRKSRTPAFISSAM